MCRGHRRVVGLTLAIALAGWGCSDDTDAAAPRDTLVASDAAEAVDAADDAVSSETDAGPDATPGDPARLDAPGEIRFDLSGIPHVYGETELDAFFLQGWATASQRMYQMDLTRRRALGRRAEVLGPSYLSQDLLFRALRLGDWARWTEEAMMSEDPELLAFFHAYAAGVNAWLEAASAGEMGQSLPPQFAGLGYTPEPWTVHDTLSIEKLVSAGLSMRPDQDLTLGLVDILLGKELFEDFYRYAAFDREYIVPDFEFSEDKTDGYGTTSASGHEIREAAKAAAQARLESLTPAQLAKALAAARSLDVSGGGSNNWVVGGEHTQSGYPVICGDSHQGVAHPAVYYFVHVSAAEGTNEGPPLDVVGASFPGVPFVVFGHNGVAGFTPTTSIYDASDTYLESFDGTTETVSFLGEDVPVESREETIWVRPNGADVTEAEPTTYTLYDVPHHGPMLPAEAVGLPLPLQVSIRWTGYRTTSLGRGFYQINKSQSFEDFREALTNVVSAGQHWVYGDIHGDIGYSSRVDLPVREIVDATTPPIRLLPGEGGYEWLPDPEGVRPYAVVADHNLPWVKNPASGYVGSGNNDPIGQTDDNTPFDDAVYLSGVFDLGTRGLRPRQRFEQARAGGRLTRDDVGQIQLDDQSRLAVRLVPFIVEAAANRADLLTPETQAMVDVLADWDFACDLDSSGAVVFQGWLSLFALRVVADDVGPLVSDAVLNTLSPQVGIVITKFLTHWLEETADSIDQIEVGLTPFPSKTGINFFDDSTTAPLETRDEMILGALAEAHAQLSAIYAPLVADGRSPTDPKSWKWGQWHVMPLVDPAEHVVPGASQPALPKPGCLYSVDVADHNWLEDGALPERLIVTNSASNRFVFEMLPEGVEGGTILPGGQDERPGSEFHNDQFQEFLDGTWRSLPHRREAVVENTSTLLEFPAGYPQ